MKLASFKINNNKNKTIGALLDDTLVDLHSSSKGLLPNRMIDFLEMSDEGMDRARNLIADRKFGKEDVYQDSEIELLPPVPRPGKILHTSCNFGDHLQELTGWNAPEWQAHNWGEFHFEHPTGFLQAPSSIVATEQKVFCPPFTKQLDHEIELGIIIGKHGKRIPEESAYGYVAGYTVFNDISARDIQAREHANNVVLLGKSFDTSCPLGPYLVTTDEIPDPNVLDMELRVNGKVHQKAKTGEMIYKTKQMVSWWSNISLEPGDLITSGSPPGVIAGWENPEYLKEGDVVEAEIEGIGILRNEIAIDK